MKRLYLTGAISAVMLACMTAAAPRMAHAANPQLDCKLRFSLTGWSAIYKHAEGHGVVTCENGKAMDVKIEAKGGGLTIGKEHVEGTGRFTDVYRIDDVLGTYAQGEATAAAGKAGTAQVLTKGTVSLALHGSGEGVDLGISVGGFTISAAR